MSTALVIHAAADGDFVSRWVIPVLSTSGICTDPPSEQTSADFSMVVVSGAAASSPFVTMEVEQVLDAGLLTIPIQRDNTAPAALHPGLESLARVDFREPSSDAQAHLAASLPTAVERLTRTTTAIAGWDHGHFSRRLEEAVSRNDFSNARSLIDTATAQVVEDPAVYPIATARRDMKALQRKRYFRLQIRLGEALLASGCEDPEVAKRYGQALIEIGDLDRALLVLAGLFERLEEQHPEWAESGGLIGRIWKQRYVEADLAEEAADPGLLFESVAVYDRVYRAKPSHHTWQGINSVSLIQRAERDGISTADLADPYQTADAIVQAIEDKEEPDCWDLATLAEAYVALDDLEKAAGVLGRYVRQPDADAFELGSTYRQFEQVLQLDQRGAPGVAMMDLLLERLFARRGGIALKPPPRSDPVVTAPGSEHTPYLVQVNDSAWKPRLTNEIEVIAQLGTIITCTATDKGMRSLIHDPDVLSIERSRPGAMSGCDISIPYVGANKLHGGAAGVEEMGDRALIGVIDGGIDVLHDCFTHQNGKTRILSVWDQTDDTGPPPAGFTVGTEHTAQDIDEFRKTGMVPGGLGRDYLSGHGTHVASIAAGRATEDRGFAGGMAPQAHLAVVIPNLEAKIGYSASHTQALQYLDTLADRFELPIVVNVSQGQNAGAHDGQSTLEAAFDMFSRGGRKPGRIVVKSAGNERGQQGHARIPVAPNSLETLEWESSDMDRPVDEIQLWFDSADDVRFRLRNPLRQFTPWVELHGDLRAVQEGSFPEGNTYLLERTLEHDDNGDSLLLIRITPGEAPAIETGRWALEIHGRELQSDGIIHAWIERDNRRPVKFVNHDNEDMTLSIPGTARTVIVVGAISPTTPPRTAGFSSFGPTRDTRDARKPDLAAPGVGIRAAQAGTKSKVTRKNGTSMAAPHVAGAVALLLSSLEKTSKPQVNAMQVIKALHQSARNYTGRWNPGQGYGILDAEQLLRRY